MATKSLSDVVRHLRRIVLVRDGAGLTDGQLLENFVADRDDASFAALVRKHAPMVWGVCRRILHNHQDAEDAFQAAFLVLVRRAAQVVPRDMVANWLYGVACQTAWKVRATAAKRNVRERQVPAMPEPQAVEQDIWTDLQPLLDQELARLPDKYRVAIVVCDLEGKTRKEAARQLGLAEGTVASRLARARALLAKRLTRRGLAVTGAVLATAVGQNAVAASVPTAVVSSTIQAATLIAAGQAATAGVISAKVAAVTEGVLKTMLLSKLKIGTAMVLTAALAIAGAGAGGLLYQTEAAGKANGAGVGAGRLQKKNADGKCPTELNWKTIEPAILPAAAQQLKDSHPGMLIKPSDLATLQDCRKCHSVQNEQVDHAKNESDKNKIRRLEDELQALRSQKELLQLEVWVLLKELQRQNLPTKAGK